MKALLPFLLAANAFAAEPVPYENKGRWGYALAGKKVVAPKYEYAAPFSNGAAPVREGGLWRFIDAEGKPAWKGRYAAALPMGAFCAPVKLAGAWGCVDRAGKAVIPFEYEELRPFSGGAAAARKNGGWGLLSETGAFTGLRFDEVYEVSEGLARVRRGGRYGYVHTDGREALPAVYDEAMPFDGGYATARMDEKYGFIDRATLTFKGKGYIGIGRYAGGLAPAHSVTEEGRCGYTDSDGKKAVIPFVYALCGPFSGGRAAVKRAVEEGWGYIDASGREVTGFVYRSAGPFENGYAKVSDSKATYYIDAEGAPQAPKK